VGSSIAFCSTCIHQDFLCSRTPRTQYGLIRLDDIHDVSSHQLQAEVHLKRLWLLAVRVLMSTVAPFTSLKVGGASTARLGFSAFGRKMKDFYRRMMSGPLKEVGCQLPVLGNLSEIQSHFNLLKLFQSRY
jgi:hypothetical protein